jgi:hypothetical protein
MAYAANRSDQRERPGRLSLCFQDTDMPRYFFSTTNGHVTRDEEGQELLDAAEAQDMAVRYLGEILHNSAPSLAVGESYELRVADEFGRPLYTLTVVATIAPTTPNAPAANDR